MPDQVYLLPVDHDPFNGQEDPEARAFADRPPVTSSFLPSRPDLNIIGNIGEGAAMLARPFIAVRDSALEGYNLARQAGLANSLAAVPVAGYEAGKHLLTEMWHGANRQLDATRQLPGARPQDDLVVRPGGDMSDAEMNPNRFIVGPDTIAPLGGAFGLSPAGLAESGLGRESAALARAGRPSESYSPSLGDRAMAKYLELRHPDEAEGMMIPGRDPIYPARHQGQMDNAGLARADDLAEGVANEAGQPRDRFRLLSDAGKLSANPEDGRGALPAVANALDQGPTIASRNVEKVTPAFDNILDSLGAKPLAPRDVQPNLGKGDLHSIIIRQDGSAYQLPPEGHAKLKAAMPDGVGEPTIDVSVFSHGQGVELSATARPGTDLRQINGLRRLAKAYGIEPTQLNFSKSAYGGVEISNGRDVPGFTTRATDDNLRPLLSGRGDRSSGAANALDSLKPDDTLYSNKDRAGIVAAATNAVDRAKSPLRMMSDAEISAIEQRNPAPFGDLLYGTEKKNTTPADNFAAGAKRHWIMRGDEPVGFVTVLPEGNTAHIAYMKLDDAAKERFGMGDMRALREEFRKIYPEINKFEGYRISGAHSKMGNKQQSVTIKADGAAGAFASALNNVLGQDDEGRKRITLEPVDHDPFAGLEGWDRQRARFDDRMRSLNERDSAMPESNWAPWAEGAADQPRGSNMPSYDPYVVKEHADKLLGRQRARTRRDF